MWRWDSEKVVVLFLEEKIKNTQQDLEVSELQLDERQHVAAFGELACYAMIRRRTMPRALTNSEAARKPHPLPSRLALVAHNVRHHCQVDHTQLTSFLNLFKSCFHP